MFRFGVLVGLFFGLAFPALSQDIDVESARRDWQQQERIADLAQRQYQTIKDEYDRAERQLQNAQQRLRDARTNLQRAQQNKVNLENEISQLSRDIPRIEQEINQTQARINQLKRDREQMQARYDVVQPQFIRLNDKVRRLNQEIADAQADGDEARVKRLQAQRSEAVQQRNVKQAQLEQIVDQLSANRQDLQTHNQKIASLRQSLTQKNNRLNASQAELPRARQAIANATDRLEQALRQRDLARDDVNEISPRLDDARRDYQRERGEADRLERRYQQVEENLRRYRQEVVDNANNQGRDSGSDDGNHQGGIDGRDDGRRLGNQEGSVQGRRDADRRDFALGKQFGWDQGIDASADSYQRGLSQGRQTANAKAYGEIYPDSFNQALDELYQKTPNNETEVDLGANPMPGEPNESINLEGERKSLTRVPVPAHVRQDSPSLNAPRSASPNVPSISISVPGSNYCNQADHRVEDDCLSAYRQSYRLAYERGYESGYRSTFRDSYDSAALNSYNASISRSTDASVYNRGKEEGAFEKGVMFGYSGRITDATAEQITLGASDFSKANEKGFLLHVVRASLVDTNDDGFFESGEPVALALEISNLGLADADKLSVKLTSHSGVENISGDVIDLPNLALDTTTKLINVFVGKVSDGASGGDIHLEGTVDYQGQGVLNFSITARRQFPLEVVEILSDELLNPGQFGKIKVKIKNNSASPVENVSMPIAAADETLELGTETLEIKSVDALSTTTIEISVKPTLFSNINQEFTFDQTFGSQKIAAQLQISKFAQLDFLANGRVMTDPTYRVRAGTNVAVSTLMSWVGVNGSRSNVKIQAMTAKSHANIRFGNNATVSADYGRMRTGSKFTGNGWRFFFPTELSDESAWIEFTIYDGNQTIHKGKVNFIVE